MKLNILSITVSGLAIIMSSIFAFEANRTNKKVNEKDYAITENLKYDLLELIATIRAMDFKAAISGHIEDLSYETECEALNQLMISPSFLLMLQAMPLKERQISELYFHFLASADKSPTISAVDIRYGCHYILDVLKDKVDIKDVLDITVIKAIHDLCDIESVVDSSYDTMNENAEEEKKVFESFIRFLFEKGVNDEDVNVFYYVLANDVDGLEAALKRGGNPKVTQGEIIERYRQYLEEFEKIGQ